MKEMMLPHITTLLHFLMSLIFDKGMALKEVSHDCHNSKFDEYCFPPLYKS